MISAGVPETILARCGHSGPPAGLNTHPSGLRGCGHQSQTGARPHACLGCRHRTPGSSNMCWNEHHVDTACSSGGPWTGPGGQGMSTKLPLPQDLLLTLPHSIQEALQLPGPLAVHEALSDAGVQAPGELRGAQSGRDQRPSSSAPSCAQVLGRCRDPYVTHQSPVEPGPVSRLLQRQKA